MMEYWKNGLLVYWNNGKIKAVGAKHSSQGVKVITAAVNKNASPWWNIGAKE